MEHPAPSATLIAAHQYNWTCEWHTSDTAAPEDELLKLVRENHRRNFDLWHQEDLARRDDLGFEAVYVAKRAIDALNQQRNNFIEQIDQALVLILRPSMDCPANSETPGMIIDRLSILALKEYHMLEQVERDDVEEQHRARCHEKLTTIKKQRSDLTATLEQFLAEIQKGTRTFRLYFQFKMYNDPSLNPQLYGKRAE